MAFRLIDPKEITVNMFQKIGSDWMLVTAGTQEKMNTMTASWGCTGVLWGKPVAICFIRPQRYTHEFIEREDTYTLSFYGEAYRPQLSLCGAKSGRKVDKVAETGLTPAFTKVGTPYFEEAELVLECRKLYKDTFRPEHFLSSAINDFYADGDYHDIYIGEIINVLTKE
jgi:flavin reductase (DIM6/NTAB) family NADH-FMN oxidoreductase RutF